MAAWLCVVKATHASGYKREGPEEDEFGLDPETEAQLRLDNEIERREREADRELYESEESDEPD